MKEVTHQFSLMHTNIAKGLACLLLLFHHLFYNSVKTYPLLTPLLNTNGIPLVCALSPVAKVCVSMFLLLSGYGIAASLKKNSTHSNTFGASLSVCIRKILSLWLSFFLIYLLFVPWQGIFGHNPYTEWYHLVIDFFGLADLFGTPTMNGTWWYISIALICYMLSPILNLLLKKAPELSVVLIFCTQFVCYGRIGKGAIFERLFWISVYFMGMVLFRFHILDRIMNLLSRSQIYGYIVLLPFVFLSFWLRYNQGIYYDPIFAFSLIIFTSVCLSRIPLLHRCLEFIGKHSANIFMMHTFIYLYNLRNLVYAPRYSPLIFGLCLIICLGISVIIELIKKAVKFKTLSDFINKKINFKRKSVKG